MIDRALVLQPDSFQAGLWRAGQLSAAGRHADSLAQLRRLSYQTAQGSFYLPWVVKILAENGERTEAEQIMKSLPAPSVPLEYVGQAALGRPAEALASISTDTVSVFMVSDLYLNPDLDPVRGDPRFAQLLSTLGRSESNARAQAWRATLPSAARK